MSYRLCGRNEAQNGRSDPYADGTGEKSSVHKCQNLAILDRTLLSIRQGPARARPASARKNLRVQRFTVAYRDPVINILLQLDLILRQPLLGQSSDCRCHSRYDALFALVRDTLKVLSTRIRGVRPIQRDNIDPTASLNPS
jgi:hypothetical protein